jgi:hypothetical protein
MVAIGRADDIHHLTVVYTDRVTERYRSPHHFRAQE